MPAKIKILTNVDKFNFLRRRWMKKFQESFDLEVYDHNKTYDKRNCVIWIDQYDSAEWAQPGHDAGFKTIYEHLWDSNIDDVSEQREHVLKLRSKNWIWMHEQWLYTDGGNQHKIQSPDPKYFMLLLMNLRRAHRHQVLDTMHKFLPDSLYSYVSQGIKLPDDMIDDTGRLFNDRFFNPSWYSQTAFSMVIETRVSDRLFISEKSFKPLAHKHPFLIYGTPGTLQHLRSLGFQTFDHIVDESYDFQPNTPFYILNRHGDHMTSLDRLNKIVEILEVLHEQFNKDKFLFSDAESQRRLDHNYHLFYNQSHIDKLWHKEIVEVVEEFVHE
jgi:hypothetical protein